MEVKQIEKKVRNKKHAHAGLLMNNYCLPPVSDSFCSVELLMAVISGKCWLPNKVTNNIHDKQISSKATAGDLLERATKSLQEAVNKAAQDE